MTEAQAREKILNIERGWVGLQRANRSHAPIIDAYNSHVPLPRGYRVSYTDAYCATMQSAAAIKAGYTDIIPIECSCPRLIELAKGMGIWVEDDAYIPKPADIILYDWQDGAGYAYTDNQGAPDHVGMAESVSNGQQTIIEGNMAGGVVGRRTLPINGRFIRGYICPKYYKKASAEQPTASDGRGGVKTVKQIAKEVIAGKWGAGDERRKRLAAAGYSYMEVQAAVNALLKSSGKKSVAEVAREVIAGKWGTGEERKKKLKAAGHDYAAVQREVNKILK